MQEQDITTTLAEAAQEIAEDAQRASKMFDLVVKRFDALEDALESIEQLSTDPRILAIIDQALPAWRRARRDAARNK